MDISVIIPAYNSADTLGRCIQAVQNSAFKGKYEIIVIDDGSMDTTAVIAEKLGARVINHTEQRGPSAARNTGAGYAKGRILVFVDSDVLIFSHTLKEIYEFLNKEDDISAISCNFDIKCEMTGLFSRYKHLYMCYFMQNQPKWVSWVFTSTFAIRNDVFRKIGEFNEKVFINEDKLLGRELVSAGYKITFGKNICVRHLHEYNITDFIKEEYRRSRTLIVIKLTTFFMNLRLHEPKISKGIKYSIIFSPFSILGILLGNVSSVFFVFMLLFFLFLNFNFLKFYYKIYGGQDVLQIYLIILLDCLICCFGIGFGFFEFLNGKRI